MNEIYAAKVRKLTREGESERAISRTLGLSPKRLREEYAEALDEGREELNAAVWKGLSYYTGEQSRMDGVPDMVRAKVLIAVAEHTIWAGSGGVEVVDPNEE